MNAKRFEGSRFRRAVLAAWIVLIAGATAAAGCVSRQRYEEARAQAARANAAALRAEAAAARAQQVADQATAAAERASRAAAEANRAVNADADRIEQLSRQSGQSRSNPANINPH